jgi:RNA polymerase sigma-70 factor, ECF subfamily
MSGKKTDKLPDAELCSRLSGEKEQAEAAFAELYARYSGRIYAYCLRFLGNCDDANDVFQETFIRFFRSAPKVKHMGSVLGYLLKTARNVCINQRRDRKHADMFEDYQVQVPPQTNEDAEFMKLITTALEMLPDDYRDPLILREYEVSVMRKSPKPSEHPCPTSKSGFSGQSR